MSLFKTKSFSSQITFAIFIVFFLCLLIVSGTHLMYTYKTSKQINEKLVHDQLVNLTAGFNENIEALRRDVRFLSSTPPIEGIIRATKGKGKDTVDGSSLKQWKDRLAVIFKEMLIVHPDYQQIRFIGVENEGKELVRVDWNQRRLERTSEKLLQVKGDETYFTEALKTPVDKVYLSEFSLNREWGKIVEPLQLVIRAAVPVGDEENKIFGVVVINMLAENLLSKLKQTQKNGETVGIYNTKIEPLVTSSLSGGWVKFVDNKTHFVTIKKLFSSSTREEPVVDGASSGMLLSGIKIFYDPMNPKMFIALSLSTSKENVYASVWSELFYQLFIMVVLIFSGVTFLYLSIKRQTIPLSDLKKLAQDLSKGISHPCPEGLEDKEDELSSLTLSFYKMAQVIEQKTAILNLQKLALDETALVSETDAKGRITYANKKFAEITGYSSEELMGTDHRIINSGHHPKTFFKELWRTIAQGNSWRGEVKNKRKDGSYYWVDSSIVPFKDLSGKIQRYISIRFDITEKKEQERKLAELTNAKAKFLAVMSHEIRTPLGAVIGLSELLASTDLSEEQQIYVNDIGLSADILLNIINDILDLSKLDSGKMQINLEPTNIYDIANGMVQIFREKTQEKNVRLDSHVTNKVPQYLELDSMRIKQVLMNLISNSIRLFAKPNIG